MAWSAGGSRRMVRRVAGTAGDQLAFDLEALWGESEEVRDEQVRQDRDDLLADVAPGGLPGSAESRGLLFDLGEDLGGRDRRPGAPLSGPSVIC